MLIYVYRGIRVILIWEIEGDNSYFMKCLEIIIKLVLSV